jgi:hypothetical protein
MALGVHPNIVNGVYVATEFQSHKLVVELLHQLAVLAHQINLDDRVGANTLIVYHLFAEVILLFVVIANIGEYQVGIATLECRLEVVIGSADKCSWHSNLSEYGSGYVNMTTLGRTISTLELIGLVGTTAHYDHGVTLVVSVGKCLTRHLQYCCQQ